MQQLINESLYLSLQTCGSGNYTQLCACNQVFFLEGIEDATCGWDLRHQETFSCTVHLCCDGEWEDDLPAREHYHMTEMDMLLIVPSLGLIPN